MSGRSPRRPHARRFSLPAALFLASLLSAVSAQGAAQAAPEPLYGSAALVALFEANYRPAPQLLDEEWAVRSLSHATAVDALPTLSFAESATWRSYDRLSVSLSLGTTVPLYRARAGPLLALHAQQAALLERQHAYARAEARAGFLSDALALRLLSDLNADVEGLVGALERSGWQAPVDAEEAFDASPAERDALAAYRHLVGLREFLETRVPELERRVSRAAGTSVSGGRLESFELLLAAVPTAPTVGQCLSSSPLLRHVALQQEVRRLELAARQSPDLRVDLYASAAYGSGSLTGTVGIEARVPLPAGWPVAGHAGVAAGLHGMEQTLSLTWPPPTPAFRPVTATERAEQQAEELAALKRELESLIGGLAAVDRAVLAAETNLLWAVRDLRGPDEPAAARTGALHPDPEPFVELHLLRLRSDLAFARLARAEELLRVALICGVGAG